jgi:hypothetical protein
MCDKKCSNKDCCGECSSNPKSEDKDCPIENDPSEKHHHSLDDFGLKSGAGEEAWIKNIKEKLNVDVCDLQKAINDWVLSNAAELANGMINIVPFGDWSKIIEDQDGKVSFLSELKAEYWKISGAEFSKNLGCLIIKFYCSSVDEGDTLEGYTYLSKEGRVFHSFANYQSY